VVALNGFFFTNKQQFLWFMWILGVCLIKFEKGVHMSNQSDSLESVVIGDGVVVKGTFTVPSKAIINGVIEGDLTAEEVLIGPTGKITGRVSAKVIDVRGQLHNIIISEKSLIVRSTGKIAGKVQYSEIEIEKGGEIEGTLSQDANGPVMQMGGPKAV
jgi:cytoskeletal protein CcmA (bactofilin family)